MSVGVEVDGLAQMQAALAAARTAVPRAVNAVFEDQATAVAGKTRQLVPRGPSGAARASVEAKGGSVTAGGSRAPYFAWLDWGGDTGGAGARGQRRFIREGRYVFPSLTASHKAIVAALEEGAADAMRAQGLEVT